MTDTQQRPALRSPRLRAAPLFPARRTCARLLLPLAALLAAGCGSMAPPYERPEPPVPPTFAGSPPGTPPGAELAAEIPWQDFFADARLKRLIGVALQNNRAVRAASLRIEEARGLYRIQRADELPTLYLGASGSRQSSRGGSQPSSASGESQAGASGAQGSLYRAGLSITAFEFDFFGRLDSLSDAALARYLATEEAYKSFQITLIAAVANTYLNLLADEELLEVTRQTLRTREESLKLTRIQFENGAASELDFRQAESLVQAARVTLAQATRQRALDQNALVLLLGQSLPADLPPAQSVIGRDVLPSLPVGLPSIVLTRRPDILQAEQQLIAANANIGAARANFYPQISLTASAGVASTELSGLFAGGRFAWTLAPQLLLPIFDRGRNRANLAATEAARDIAVTQYELAIQTAFREVSDALASRATLAEETRAQLAQVDAEAARLRLATLRYRSGASSYLDVLDAQRSHFAARLAAVQVRAAQIQNQVTLYKVLGGGWK